MSKKFKDSTKTDAPSTTTKATRAGRARNASTSEEAPDHVKKLRTTLRTFPIYDLSARGDFVNVETEASLGGRTFKKIVVPSSEASQATSSTFLLKKNGREMARDEDGEKTPSKDMNLDINHEESFREICALRLFQLIWQDPETTTKDARIILSGFDPKKPQNIAKEAMTKVYFASEKIKDIAFDVARLSVVNSEILEKKDGDGHLINKDLIDQLCEQTIVQCILSNPDAIKFDNFFVNRDASKVVHFDFGDARNNEYCNPDPLCLIDSIRKHFDPNSTRSTKMYFDEENAVYRSSIRFFNRHISPIHLLNVIEKLKRIPIEVLWQATYNYTYGDEKEKRIYADCLVARVLNTIKLEEVIKKINESKSGEEFFTKPIRSLIFSDEFYREGKQTDEEFFIELNKMFGKVETFVQKHYESLSLDDASSSEAGSSDDDIRFQDDDDAQQPTTTESTNDSEEEEEEEEATNSSNDQSQESSDEDKFSDDDSEASQDSEIAEEDEEDIAYQAFLEDIRNSRLKLNAICDEFRGNIVLPIEYKETVPEEAISRKTDNKISINQLDSMRQKVEAFYQASKNFERYTEEQFMEYIETTKSDIMDKAFSFFVHNDAYKTFREVQQMNLGQDPLLNEAIKSRFGAIGVNVEREPSGKLMDKLSKINPRIVEDRGSGKLM